MRFICEFEVQNVAQINIYSETKERTNNRARRIAATIITTREEKRNLKWQNKECITPKQNKIPNTINKADECMSAYYE